MQSSDKLNISKTQLNIYGQFRDVSQKLKQIKEDIQSLKKEQQNTKILINNIQDANNKQFDELYAFCNKLEKIYRSGLSNFSSNNSINDSQSNTTSNISIQNITSSKDAFPIS